MRVVYEFPRRCAGDMTVDKRLRAWMRAPGVAALKPHRLRRRIRSKMQFFLESAPVIFERRGTRIVYEFPPRCAGDVTACKDWIDRGVRPL